MNRKKIALAVFLRSCPSVMTLGVRTSMDDYTGEEKDLMRNADRIFFPTPRFVDIFQAIGIPTFPAPTTYRYQRSRMLQQTLFQYLGFPHNRSRVYFGARQKERITRDFGFPVLAMGPYALPGTKHLARGVESLRECIARYNPVLIQEAAEYDERVRFIFVGFRCIGAFRQSRMPKGVGAFLPVSIDDAGLLKLRNDTAELTRLARLDDILIEWGKRDGRWLAIEMARPPFRFPSPMGIMDRHLYICELIEAGFL